MAHRRLTVEPFHVRQEFVDAELASPRRRALAFGVDCLLLVIPTLVCALGVAALSFYWSNAPAARAVWTLVRSGNAQGQPAREAALTRLLPVLAHLEAPGLPAAAAAAIEEGDLERAAALVKDLNIQFAMSLAEEPNRKAPIRTIIFPVEKLIPGGIRFAALFGVPALYFAAFTRGRRGATPGKRLAGIRVVRLDGERLPWIEAFERFVGYIHIPATAGISLRDLWHDPNRRLPHDRAAHTAVIRIRRTKARE